MRAQIAFRLAAETVPERGRSPDAFQALLSILVSDVAARALRSWSRLELRSSRVFALMSASCMIHAPATAIANAIRNTLMRSLRISGFSLKFFG